MEPQKNNPQDPATMIALFRDAMREIVAEIRKPPVDPIKEAQKAREKAQKEAGLKQMWSNRLWKLIRCSHSRQDGTCVIGWAIQSDGKQRGYCPNCDNTFGPELVELEPLMTEEMKKLCPSLKALYDEQRKRPRGLMENVRYVS